MIFPLAPEPGTRMHRARGYVHHESHVIAELCPDERRELRVAKLSRPPLA